MVEGDLKKAEEEIQALLALHALPSANTTLSKCLIHISELTTCICIRFNKSDVHFILANSTISKEPTPRLRDFCLKAKARTWSHCLTCAIFAQHESTEAWMGVAISQHKPANRGLLHARAYISLYWT